MTTPNRPATPYSTSMTRTSEARRAIINLIRRSPAEAPRALWNALDALENYDPPMTLRETVLEYIAEHDGCSMTTVKNRIPGSNENVWATIRDLLDEGLIFHDAQWARLHAWTCEEHELIPNE